uniref:Uncharacterized protein n=1 Tax=viral metagenome TaxID=1070528 RepID=A0A6M3MAZ5_9ZZZZ
MKPGTIEHIEYLAQSILGVIETLKERTRLQGDHVLNGVRDHTEDLIESIHKHPDWKPPTTDLLARSCSNCSTETRLLKLLKSSEMGEVIDLINQKCIDCKTGPVLYAKNDYWSLEVFKTPP